MARHRCVCPFCTGYIRSEPEPLAVSDRDTWSEMWDATCRAFLSEPCPHDGDGYEDEREWLAMVALAEEQGEQSANN